MICVCNDVTRAPLIMDVTRTPSVVVVTVMELTPSVHSSIQDTLSLEDGSYSLIIENMVGKKEN